jgi:nicotinamidase-related amidase
MSGVAVVLVDVQRDFLDPGSSEVGAWEKAFCVPGIQRLLELARGEGWPVAHVGTKHESAATLPLHQRARNIPPYCRAGTSGCEFVVRPGAADRVAFKTWYSALESESADALPDEGTIVWGGVATDCCVQQSAFDADRRGLRNVIPIQAVSASTGDAFSASLTSLGKSAAAVVDLEDVLEGKDFADIALEIDQIAGRAERWFSDQENRLGNPSGLDLADVLSRLDAVPT